MKYFRFITAVSILSLIAVFPKSDAWALKKKKLFIGAIQGKNIPTVIPKNFQNGISSLILEKYSNRYNIIDENDIKAVLKREEFNQIIGCSDIQCMQMIGESLRADEMIYGEMSRSKDKYAISITNLQKIEATQSFSKKSLVQITCYENQLEWYAKEAGKKLINPRYRIKKPDISDLGIGSIELGKLEVKRVKGVDISILKFESPDRVIGVLLPLLKDIVNPKTSV